MYSAKRIRIGACAALLLMVPFIHSMHGIGGWGVSGVAWLEASGEPVAPTSIVAPADFEMVRGDGARIRLRADQARLWTSTDASSETAIVELSGNVVVNAPEGEIHASRLEFDSETGEYTAEVVSIRP